MMTTDATTAAETITERVRARYARAAHQAQTGVRSCCSSDCCSSIADDPVTANLYDVEQTAGLPEAAVLASLGCGNPTALIDLQPGETVLDLGSGGGITGPSSIDPVDESSIDPIDARTMRR